MDIHFLFSLSFTASVLLTRMRIFTSLGVIAATVASLSSATITKSPSSASGPDGSFNPCRDISIDDQVALDECYMQLALDHVMIHNPSFPFGALIVDHTTNEISCYGANSNRKNKLLHGKYYMRIKHEDNLANIVARVHIQARPQLFGSKFFISSHRNLKACELPLSLNAGAKR